MTEKNPLQKRLEPHVTPILVDAANPTRKNHAKAKQIIDLYRLHLACPSDPGAPGLCEAAFEEWLACQKKGGQ